MKPWILSAVLVGALVLVVAEPRLDRSGPTPEDLVPVQVAIGDDMDVEAP